MQFVIYTFLFEFFSKDKSSNNSLITFYILIILPIYFTSFVYYNLKDKNIAIQDKIYKSIKDIYEFKKENIKFVVLFVILFGINKLSALKIKILNLKLVNTMSLISYIIILTATLYVLMSSSRKIKFCKGENGCDAKF
ncbi:hypothetical protein [Peptoniphilus timonensis]|uniref:hypothetical protein n=1 Tax=Peptoniphilus timonensis TaxID=1268254 RepID=UPI0012DE49BC|nr:hypothetical protein [Peptoniphilus timonensis]